MKVLIAILVVFVLFILVALVETVDKLGDRLYSLQQVQSNTLYHLKGIEDKLFAIHKDLDKED